MQDLLAELQAYSKELTESVNALRSNGINYARAERDYKVLLRKECLKLRDDGMAVGMIDKTCYGIPAVADARFKRDVEEAVYKANIEHINAVKLQLRLIESQIGREWSEYGRHQMDKDSY